MTILTGTQRYRLQKVSQMPVSRPGRSAHSRLSILRSQLGNLQVGEIGRILCETKEEASSIRSDVYKLIKELGWSEGSEARPAQKTAICEEGSGWALYVTRFG